jgi:hypothetical protein
MKYKLHNLIYAQKIVNDWLRSIATIFFHVRDWIQSISIQTRVTSLIIMMATLIRAFLLASGWPLLDGDQGTMGLAALHIFHGTDYPIFFYGQTYMGTIEAYIAALIFHISGISTFSLRIGLLFFYVGFLINMFLFIRKLFSANFAVLTILLLALGAPNIVYWQLSPRGGYPEIPFFASSLLLIAVHLALKLEQQYSTTQQLRHFSQKDVWFYGMWGFIAGFSIYDDPLIIPFVVVTGFILLISLYRRKVIINYIVIIVTFLLGISPIFIYTVLHPGSSVFQVGASAFSSIPTPLFTLHRLKTLAVQSVHTVLISIPVMTGGNTLCPTEEVEHLGVYDPATETCIGIHALWGVFITALLLFAGYIYLRNIFKRQNSQSVPRASILKEVCRFASIPGMIMTILLLMLSSQPYNIMTPWKTSRYLIAFEVIMPCMLYSLWEISCNSRYFQLAKRFGQVSILIIVCIYGIGMFLTFIDIQNAQVAMLRDKDLIHTLQRRGIVHIYTNYGPCNGLTFLSQETILCNVAEDPLHPTGNRYVPDGVVVEHDSKTAYIYLVGSSQSQILLHSTAKKLTHSIIDGYDIFTNT